MPEVSAVERDRLLCAQLLRQMPPATKAEIARTLGRSERWVLKVARILAERGEDGLADRRARNHRPPRYVPDDFAAILARREQQPTAGAPMLVMSARRQGEATPSVAAVSRKLNELGLANKPIGPKDQRLFPRPQVSQHGDLRIMDGWSSWWVADQRVYLATLGDPHSRLVIAEFGWGEDGNMYTRGLARSWQHLGPATVLSLDNGIGLCLDTLQGTTPQVVRWALAHGAAVLFIPPAQPWRNGHLERFHWTMQREYWAYEQPATQVAAQQGLLAWLNYYNTQRSHSSLGYAAPSAFGTYAPLGGEVLDTPEKLPPQAGAISFIRLVEAGGLVDCQGAICRVSPVLVGQYVTVRCTLSPGHSGQGVITWQPKKDALPEEVGAFRHYIDRRIPRDKKLFSDLEYATTVAGVPGNEGLIQQQYDRRLTRHLKKSYGRRGTRMQQALEDLAAEEA